MWQPFQNFHVVSLGDFVAIGGSDVEGRLAVQHNTAISQYSVSYVVPPPTPAETYLDPVSGTNVTTRNDLVTCGFLEFLSGAVMGGGNAVYVNASSDVRVPLASTYPPGRILQQDVCPLDFDDIAARMVALSTNLAQAARTGTSVQQYTYVLCVCVCVFGGDSEGSSGHTQLR